MNDIENKKAALVQAYPSSSTWKSRVMSMRPNQVVALYLKFKNEGKIR